MNLTYGSDPEFIINDPELNGNVSALRLWCSEGEKECPLQFSIGAVMADGVMLEAIIPPAVSISEFISNLRKMILDIHEKITPLVLIADAMAKYNPIDLKHPKANEFGCSPDFTSWNNGKENKKPIIPKDFQFRPCGAHLHIGFKREVMNTFSLIHICKLVNALDASAGLCSVLLDDNEFGRLRKKFYGAAGCFRPKDYGLEYRTMSTRWLSSPEIVFDVLALVEKAISQTFDGWNPDPIVRKIINDVNSTVALDLLRKQFGAEFSCNFKGTLLENWR